MAKYLYAIMRDTIKKFLDRKILTIQVTEITVKFILPETWFKNS